MRDIDGNLTTFGEVVWSTVLFVAIVTPLCCLGSM